MLHVWLLLRVLSWKSRDHRQVRTLRLQFLPLFLVEVILLFTSASKYQYYSLLQVTFVSFLNRSSKCRNSSAWPNQDHRLFWWEPHCSFFKPNRHNCRPWHSKLKPWWTNTRNFAFELGFIVNYSDSQVTCLSVERWWYRELSGFLPTDALNDVSQWDLVGHSEVSEYFKYISSLTGTIAKILRFAICWFAPKMDKLFTLHLAAGSWF